MRYLSIFSRANLCVSENIIVFIQLIFLLAAYFFQEVRNVKSQNLSHSALSWSRFSLLVGKARHRPFRVPRRAYLR